MSRKIPRSIAVVLPVVAISLVVGCADRATLTDPAIAPPASRVIGIPLKPNPSAYVEITAGSEFTCARRNSGTVICWGAIIDAGEFPTAVRMPTATLDTLRATSISAGDAHMCAVNTASDGVCWGDGNQGQLGNNLGYGPMQPELVAGGHKFFAIGGGSMVSCGVASDGVFCWGRHPDWTVPTSDDIGSPVLISTFNGSRTVTVGAQHACTMETFGTYRAADCWGIDSVGQLAIDPAFFPNFAPFDVRAQFGTSVRRVVAHDSVTCAEQTSGAVQCAGLNRDGQLGNGTSGPWTFVPQTVAGGHNFHGVTMGPKHGCAIDEQNHAFCWGNNDMGQLGDGTLNPSTVPVAVSGGLTFTAIAAGYQHTCAIGTDNGLYCWGANYFGQAGQGTSNNIAWVNPGRVHDPR